MKDSPESFTNLVNLLSVYTEASIRLAELQSSADTQLMEAVDEQRPDYVRAQTALEESEKAIKDLAQAHPEWLDGRTIKTPYGSIRFTKSTKLEIPNPEATIALINSYFPGDLADAFQRVTTEPNVETLETLPDEDLARLGISRVTTDSISVKPAKVDMGKAQKAGKEKAAK